MQYEVVKAAINYSEVGVYYKFEDTSSFEGYFNFCGIKKKEV